MMRCLCYSALFTATALQSAAASQSLEALAEKHVGKIVADGEVASAALLIHVGDETASYFFGETTPGSQEKPDASTCYEIGSITKTFTATLLARAVAEDRLQLDTPLAEAFEEGPAPLAQLPKHITFETLAAHRAGIPRLPGNLEPADTENPYREYDQAALYKALADLEATSTTPTYQYSNFGYALLGHALALLAEKPYHALVHTHLFEALAMEHTTVHPSAADRKSCAPPHTVRRIRLFGPRFQECPAWDFDVVAPAGAITAPLDDMGRYLAALLHPEDTVFEKLRPMLLEEREEINDELAVGLAWHLLQRGEGPTLAWHNGGTGGSSAFLGFYPDAALGIVLLTNTANTPAVDGAAIGLLEALYDREN